MTLFDDKWFEEQARRASSVARELPDASESGFAERLGALCFILLDTLDDAKDDAQNGQNQHMLRAFRRHAAGLASPFRGALRVALLHVTDSPDIPGVNRLIVDSSTYRFLLSGMVSKLVEASLEDESEDRATSAALIDRTVAFLSELSTDRVPQRLIDLVKYQYESGYFSVSRIPIIGDIFCSSDEAD